MREPTMADIAARLGVSRQLVSIALRRLPEASSETRERVHKAAEELGYRPHLAPSVSVVEPWLVVRGSTARPARG